jgi:hypothetical protein
MIRREDIDTEKRAWLGLVLQAWNNGGRRAVAPQAFSKHLAERFITTGLQSR